MTSIFSQNVSLSCYQCMDYGCSYPLNPSFSLVSTVYNCSTGCFVNIFSIIILFSFYNLIFLKRQHYSTPNAIKHQHYADLIALLFVLNHVIRVLQYVVNNALPVVTQFAFKLNTIMSEAVLRQPA